MTNLYNDWNEAIEIYQANPNDHSRSEMIGAMNWAKSIRERDGSDEAYQDFFIHKERMIEALNS